MLSPAELGLEAGDLGAWWPLCSCRYCGPEPICKAMPGAGTALLGCLVRVHPTVLLMRNGLCGECWEASKGEPPDEPNEPSKDEPDEPNEPSKNDKKKDEPDEPNEPSKDEPNEPSKGGKSKFIKPTKGRLVMKPSKG